MCAVAGFVAALPLAEVLEGSMTAVFVCYCREPSFMKEHHPDLYDQVNDAFEMLEGGGGEGDEEPEYYDYDDEPGGKRGP